MTPALLDQPMPSSSPILLFVKAPVKGKVKSRLAAGLGEDTALELYKNFVLDILETIERTGRPCTIFFHPPDARGNVARWLGPERTYLPQDGMDLGQRMENAFATIFKEGVSGAVLIGSDIPDLPVDLLVEAGRKLESHDAVLGPAGDGGYYLIGFRRDTFLPAVFRDMPWGTGSVFSKTRDTLARAGLRVHHLPVWGDVDTVDDLKDLMARSEKTAFAASKTVMYLKKIKI